MTTSPELKPKKTANKKRVVLFSTLGFFAVAFVFCCYIGVLGGNVREVAPGKVYRSATLTGLNYTGVTAGFIGNTMENVLKDKKIKTVINLRGGSNKDEWYREEVEACDKLAVKHIDFGMSARKLPPPQMVEGIIRDFDQAQYPILIHCQAGADRTGLVSTLYSYLYKGETLDQAQQEQLTWKYGHFPVANTHKMDEFFDLYRKYGEGCSFRDWLHVRYPPIYLASPH